ncbi:hypothetical protein ACVWZ4_004675 [Bradyrhizobium sp. USDA 4472]
MRLGELGLLIAADGTDHGCAEMLGPLAQDQANAARRGMQQNGVASLHTIGLPDQVLRGQPLQHHCSRGHVVDPVRQLQKPIGRDQPRLGIGAKRRSAVCDTVTRLQISDAWPDFFDNARGLAAEPTRQLGRIHARAVVDVDEVEANSGMANARLAWSRLADIDLLPNQNVRTAGFVKANGMGHGRAPLSL